MSSLAQTELPRGAELEAMASGLLGSRVVAIEPQQRGGNNRLYRVTALDGVYALKFYPRQAADPRDRQGAEAGALRFLERYAVSSVPRLVAEDRRWGCSAFDWVEGQPVGQPGAADVDGALRFVAELQALAAFDDSARLPLASAATLSAAALCTQIEWRLERCREVAVNARIGELEEFLEHAFSPIYEQVVEWARARFGAEKLDFATELPLGRRTLSPSDFGFHNALRRPNGRLVFLDFEYFGWDDPVKMVADFLWHPGMELGPGLKSRFAASATAVFAPGDATFERRLNTLFPLYGLCWVLIVLNEFLPESWHRRSLAREGRTELDDGPDIAANTEPTVPVGPDLATVKRRQLARARKLVEVVGKTYEAGAVFD